MTQYPLMTEPPIDPPMLHSASERAHELRLQAESDPELFARVIGIRDDEANVDFISELIDITFDDKYKFSDYTARLHEYLNDNVNAWASRKARECGGE